MTTKRPLVSDESIAAAMKYDADHIPGGRSWQAATTDQAGRIICGWLLWLADTFRENAP